MKNNYPSRARTLMLPQTTVTRWQKALTVITAALVSAMLLFPMLASAQSVVLGTGTSTTNGTSADPVGRYFAYEHYQMVWTAAELSAAGMPAGAQINAIGFSVSEAPSSLVDYTIEMGHTANANAGSHISTGLSVVRTPFTYAPVVQAAGSFDMIALTSTFSWDGSSNLVVDVCTGSNPFTTPYGGVRYTTTTSGMRYTRSDFTPQCGNTTGTTSSNRPNVQFNYTVPSCLPPSALTASAVAETSATVSWTASTSNPSGGYEWEVRSTGIAGGGATGLEASGSTAAGVVTASATGLPENTDLSLYVRANCGGGDYSSWVGPYDFTTLCSVATVPYFEGFESDFTDQSEVAGCWSQQSLTGIQTWTANSSLTTYNRSPRTGSFNAYLRYSNDDWLFRGIQLTGGTSYTFEVYARQDGTNTANANITLAYGSTASAAGMTNTIVLSAGLDNNYQQITGTFTPATTGTYYVGVKGFINGSPWYISLDDIRVFETPSCQPPTVGASTAVTATSATLNWTASPSNPTDGYEWEVRSSGVGGSGATGLEASGTVAAGVVTASATGLPSDQTLSVYVRSNCGGGSFSAWNGPTTFFTGYCQPNPSSVDGSGITNVTFGSTSVVNNTTGSEAGNYGDYSAQVGDGQQGTVVAVDITYSTGYTYGTRIWVDWNNDLDFADAGEEVYTGLSTSANPTTLNASFTIPLATPLGNYRMRIGGSDNNAGVAPCYTGSYASFEDYTLEVTAAPTCFLPSNGAAGTITNNSAVLTWDAASPAPSNGYDWEVRSSGVGGSGATGLEASGSVAAGVLTDNATGLPGNTALSIYVRSNCGGGDFSDWAGPFTFTTLCDPGTIPFSEGFESGYTQSTAVAGCWTQGNVQSANVWEANDNLTSFNRSPRTGSWNAYLRYGNEDWLFYPLTVVGGTQYTFDVYARQDGSTTTNANIVLAYGSADNAGAMTNTVATATGLDANYQLITGTFTPASSGVIYVGIKGFMNFSPYYISLDDIAVYETPSCLPPTATAATDVTLTSATVNWTASASAPVSGYEWEVRSSGAGGSGATGLEASGTTADAVLSASATGLPSDQTLSVYVRADCGANQSPWNGPITFYTGYCQPSPSSVDGSGITNVTFGVNNVVNNTTGTETNNYGDYSAQVGDGAAGTNLGVDVTFTTGVTYNLRIWVDWNDDLDFDDADEMAYYQASVASGSAHSATIAIPAGATVGNHRMRIGGADFGLTAAGDWCTTGSWRCYEDYTLEVTPAPTCFPPAITSATATSYTAADFAWSAASPAPANGYNWEVRTSGAGGSGATGLVTSGSTAAGVLTASATGLTASTTYQLYVRSNCGGGDFSTWDGPFEFITDYCVAETSTSTSSYVNQFNTTSSVVGNANISNIGTGYATNGYDDRTTEAVEMHATGSVDFTAGFVGTTVGFNIWVDWNNDLQFDVSERMYASGGYVSSATGTITVPSGTANGDYRMRIRCNWNSINPDACGSITRGETEDYTFTVVDPPACADPTVTAATNLTLTSADLNWTASPSNPANGYEWEVRSSGAGGSGATGLEASGSVAAGVVTANAIGLPSNTTLSVYVRSNCGGGTYSAWDGPVTFFTGYCVPNPSSVDGTGISNVTYGQTAVVNNSTGTETGNYGDYTAFIGDGQQGTSVAVDITFGHTYTYNTRIWVDWNNDLDFADAGEEVFLGTSSGGSNPHTLNASFTIPVATTLGNYRMRIGGRDFSPAPGPCYTGSYGAFEDYTLQVTAAPTCFDPTVTAATSVTNSTATLNWTAASPAPANGYFWEVRVSGAPGSGVTGLEASGSVAAGVVTASATGLPSNTTLSVYVRSSCGGGDFSGWDGPVTFNTLCDPGTIPFFEGFESGYVEEDAIAGCWSQEDILTAAESWEANDTYTSYNRAPRTGSWNAMLRYYASDWLFYPLTLAGGTEYTFEVYARQDATSGVSMTLAYGTSGDAASMTNTVVGPTAITNGGYQQIVGTFTPPSNGVYYIGIFGDAPSYSPWYLSIDDIQVYPTPACQQPAAVSAPTIVSFTEADLAWLASPSAPADGYEWEVRSSGAGGSGATGLEASGSTAAGVLTATATGLPAETNLNVYVRANCGSGSFSPWAGPTSFFSGYCQPAPTSVDGSGITNVTFGQTTVVNNSTGTETNNYGDYSALIGDGQQGVALNVDITYGHSSTYPTRIWVDWNGDLDFLDAGEEVYIGTSAGGSNPHTLNASFTIPIATPLGNYRMRIGGRDFSPAPGPCYTGSWGSFEDYTLEVTPAPTCYPPTVDAVTDVALNTATLNWTAPSNVPSDGYTWEVRSSGAAGSGPVGLEASGTVAAGVTTASAVGLPPLTDLFVYVRGFCGGGDYSTWAGPETFTTIPDECAQAATWPTIPADGSCATQTINTGAASQSQAACIGTANDDVWFEFTVPAGNNQINYSTTDISGSGDRVFQLFDVCGGSSLYCQDAEAGFFSGLTAGNTYVLRVYTYFNSASEFDLCLSVPPPPPANDDCANAINLECGQSVAGSTIGSVSESVTIGCGMSQYGVWYKFTGNGYPTTIDVSATGYDIELGIASGSCGTLSNVICRDFGTTTESYTFTTTDGVDYYIYIAHWSSFSNETGDFTISRSCSGFANWTGVVSSDWNNPSNWSFGVVPSATDDAFIPTTPIGGFFPVIDETAEINSIFIEPAARVTITDGFSLTVNDVLDNDGEFTVQSGGSLVQVTGSTLAGSGLFRVLRNGSNVYDYWSSSVTSQSVNSLPGCYEYDPATGTDDPADDEFDPGWVAATGNLVPGKGYAAFGVLEAGFFGTVNNGDITANVEYHGLPNVAWNLIGNPYPSGVTVSQFLSTNIGKLAVPAVYLWDDPGTFSYGVGDYAVRNAAGGTAGGGGNTPGPVLGTAQGFKVKVNSSATTIEFNNAMRSTGNSAVHFRPAASKRLWLNVTSTGAPAGALFNQTLVGFFDDGTEGLDIYDAPKLNWMSDLSLYSLLNNEPYSIQGYGPFYEEAVFPIGLHIGPEQVVTFEIDHVDGLENNDIYLEDVYLGEYHDLNASNYTFTAAPGIYNDRFLIHFTPQSVTSVEELNSSNIGAYISDDILTVSSKEDKEGILEVLDVSGRVIFSTENALLNQSGTKIDMSNVSDGIYIVRFAGSEETLSKKVLK